MRLTEEVASRWIAEWTADCAFIAPAPPTLLSKSPLTHPRMIIGGDFAGKTLDRAKEHALSLRRAMEGLNALAACAGYDPEENAALWHRELERMCGTSRLAAMRLSCDVFSRFEITNDFGDSVPSSRLVSPLSMCIAKAPSSAAMEVRRQVIEQLRDYLLSIPPSLDLMIGSSYDSDCGWRFPHALQSLADLRLLMSDNDPVPVVMGRADSPFCIEDANDLAFSGTEVIKTEAIDVKAFYGYRKAILSVSPRFQQIMTTLVMADTVEMMYWEIKGSVLRDTVTLCSALPYMRSLKALEFVDKNFKACAWLAFALKSRVRRGLDLALSLEIHPLGYNALATAMKMNRLRV